MTPAERVVRLGEASFRVADGKDGFWDRYEAGQWEPETLAALRRHVGPGAFSGAEGGV